MRSSLSLSKVPALAGGAIAASLLAAVAAALDFGGHTASLAAIVAAGLMTAAVVAVGGSLRRLHSVAIVLQAAGRGEFEPRVMEASEAGVVGDVQRAANNSLDIADAFVREAGGAMKAASESRFHRKVLLRGLPGAYQGSAIAINDAAMVMEEKSTRLVTFAGDFERDIGSIVVTVSDAAVALSQSAGDLSGAAAEASTRTAAAAEATSEVTVNTQTVAAATEELASSVTEISRQVSEAASVTRDAVGQATDADAAVVALAERASRIGDMVQIISSIASQTNLLALNATIEAARAGDAGKGFAVVAGEVKLLAAQTAKATDEIGQLVVAIRTATETAVVSIRSIGGTIQRVDHATSAIAAAVEQQGAATREIARSVDSTARGVASASGDIEGVRAASRRTGEAADQVSISAKGLAGQSALLQEKVGVFLNATRAA